MKRHEGNEYQKNTCATFVRVCACASMCEFADDVAHETSAVWETFPEFPQVKSCPEKDKLAARSLSPISANRGINSSAALFLSSCDLVSALARDMLEF